jgi:hypothetical protein
MRNFLAVPFFILFKLFKGIALTTSYIAVFNAAVYEAIYRWRR